MRIEKKISFAKLIVLWEYIQAPKLTYKKRAIDEDLVILHECIFDRESQTFSVSVDIVETIDHGTRRVPKEFVREILKTVSEILDILPGDFDFKVGPSDDEDERSTQ